MVRHTHLAHTHTNHTKHKTTTHIHTHQCWSETHAVQGLFLTVQLDSSGDDPSQSIDVEVLPVPVPSPGLQEGVAHLTIYTLITICSKHLVHQQAWGLLLHKGE